MITFTQLNLKCIAVWRDGVLQCYWNPFAPGAVDRMRTILAVLNERN